MSIFINRLSKIDLHGYDYQSAYVATNDFIEESYLLNQKDVVIVHGIGEGIVKKSVHDALSRNKKVKEYKICPDNIGCTIVEIISK